MTQPPTPSAVAPTYPVTISQPDVNGWMQILSENGLLQTASLMGLTAYDGGDDVHAEVESRLSILDSGEVSAPRLLRVIQGLVAQVQRGDMVDDIHLEQTQLFSADLVRECPPDDPRRVQALSLAVVTGVIVNWKTGKKEDLDDLITHLFALLEVADRTARIGVLGLLAGALFERFNLQRNLDDLNGTCDHLLMALALLPDDASRASTCMKLGVAFSTRFDMVGQMSDLEKAIEYHKQGLGYRAPGNDCRSLSLYHLANDLVKRFEQMDDESDLEFALQHHREALALLPTGDPLRHLSLISFGRAMVLEFQRFGRRDDLEQAIECHHEALHLCPVIQPEHGSAEYDEQRFRCLSALVFSLRIYCEVFGTARAQEAIDLGLEAQALLPEGHPLLVEIQRDLAFLHLCFPEPRLDACFHFFRRAVGQETASAKERLSAAVGWASCARRHGDASTEEAYAKAMEQLNRCLAAYSTVDSQHEFLARNLTRVECATLASDAASFAIENDRWNDAVEIIEQGRTFIWSRMRGYRHPIEQLRKADSARAIAFQHLSGEVERFAVTFDSRALSVPFSGALSAARANVLPTSSPSRRDLANEWTKKLEDIRTHVPGFRDFLKPLPFIRLRRAAADGPVIILNQTQYRSDALIVLKTAQSAICVPLTGDLGELARLQATTGTHTYIRSGGARLFVQMEGFARTEKATVDILRGIWNILEPVVSALRSHGVREMSRIWWCPTSFLGTLPLHAGGQYTKTGNNLPDIYISSYTPTLSALITARESLKEDPGSPPTLLVVGASGTAGHQYALLPAVCRECDVVRSWLPEGKDLIDKDATCTTVLAELPKHSWVHFASHAMHSQTQPLDSSIILHDDEVLRLRQFMMSHPVRARLAVIAACDGAAGSTTTPDEVLHLAAAVQFSGFCSVVGSLWYMMDDCGPDLANAFYGHLLRNGAENVVLKDSAEALNRATNALRKKGVKPEHWVNFVHIGV
ncbi:CHAT domain-containing protein [Mycena sp. CBHHK59/15]|nr:CHAT domain-containing protein [Mycena sp. CBHHK59/15]